MGRKISRGDIYYADLNPVIGSEQGGVRPVLVIQNDTGNFYSPTVIVAAFSGQIVTKARLPTHHIIKTYAGLDEPSLIMLEQIRTIDKQRLQCYVGHINSEDMAKVNKCLIISLNLVIA